MNHDPLPSRSLDEAIVRSISNWAVLTTLGIALFDIAILWNYPFPGDGQLLPGIFYSVAGVVLVAASIGCAFLGYRIVSTRFVRRSKRVYVIFLPLMALVGSVVWLYLLSPAT
ncbi:MAG: hypothetical protein DCC58_19480 [Chloroflexi bacterium]|nr:MAG: hypothetical protein DCC58_19480 [Chloroflexota bacterium]